MNKYEFNNKKIVIASHNKGKVEEIKILLRPLKIEVLSADDFNLKEPKEDGFSFEENSLIKSSYVCNRTGIPSLSDDSGICFSDLNNEPGIYSARWAGKNKDFKKAMHRIADALLMSGKYDKKAHFHCALCLSWPDGQSESVEGILPGQIVWPARGNRGFGYDPIFMPDGYTETFGEMDPVKKHKISHRSVAYKKLIEKCFPTQ